MVCFRRIPPVGFGVCYGLALSPMTPNIYHGDSLLPSPSVASALGWGSCPVCHQPMTARRGVALTGEQFCDRHLGQTNCRLCAMPAKAHDRTIALCRRCASTSIRTQADVKRELPAMKRQLADLGIRTITPVRVELATPEQLDGIANNHALGVTISRERSVVRLLVRQDLPFVKFGTTVAHEVMHTWMTQNGFGELPPLVAEGLCQMLAHAWIRRQDGILAAAERHQIENNPDPIYGEGFRKAIDAVRRAGLPRTLDTVKLHRRFP
jgi:hypothetical protein